MAAVETKQVDTEEVLGEKGERVNRPFGAEDLVALIASVRTAAAAEKDGSESGDAHTGAGAGAGAGAAGGRGGVPTPGTSTARVGVVREAATVHPSAMRLGTAPSSFPVTAPIPSAAAAAAPGDHVVMGGKASRGIRIGEWVIFAAKSHIASDAVADRWHAELGFALPEMVYPHNGLVMWHQPSGVCFAFTARGALEGVRRVDPNEQIQVPFAAEWQRSARRDVAKQVIQRYDWTFSSEYEGATARFDGSDDSSLFVDASADGGVTAMAETIMSTPKCADRIPFDKLMRRDPILFFDDVPLFEDELHDCGLANCSVKVRVMPERWFVLMRCWMRIDGGLIRSAETRLFHEMGSDTVLRMHTVKEAQSKDLQKKHADVELSNPASFLRVLPTRSETVTKVTLM